MLERILFLFGTTESIQKQPADGVIAGGGVGIANNFIRITGFSAYSLI